MSTAFMYTPTFLESAAGDNADMTDNPVCRLRCRLEARGGKESTSNLDFHAIDA